MDHSPGGPQPPTTNRGGPRIASMISQAARAELLLGIDARDALVLEFRTTTRRFWASPSAALSLPPTWWLSPIAPGASMLVSGIWPCCRMMLVTLLAR